MKKISVYALSLMFVAGIYSCDSTPASQEQAQEKTEQSTEEKSGKFNYAAGDAEVGWTAYKFTEKVGVSGVFENIEITGTESAETPEGVFANAAFTIPINSINSNDEGRDHKIQEFFFGTLDETSKMTGKLVSFGDDGTAVFTLSMNGTVQEVTGEYEVEDNVLSLVSNIDVSAWGAESGIAALNKVCDELHKGEDGKSVLWPDVKINIKAALSRE